MHEKNFVTFNTYKNLWIKRNDTGCYERYQKKSYPLEWMDLKILRSIPKVRGVMSLLGRKPQEVDFYRYYSDVLLKKNRGKWVNEFENAQNRLQHLGISLKGKSILDISGEPGFFAYDATLVCGSVDVTAFADTVTSSMKTHLNISVETYDFNKDNLAELFKNKKYDFIFIRWAIGFCKDLQGFIAQCRELLVDNGIIYISYSPASRAVCARWMFDDYTYLRQYTKKYLNDEFLNRGFTLVSEYDEGSYFWNKDLYCIQKIIAKFYTKKIFHEADPSELYQHNATVIFRLGK